MCAVLVVVANILREPAFQVAFVNCDDVIQEITPATPYPTLCDSILPRTFERSADRIHPQGSNRCGDLQSILGITIKDDEPRSGSKWKCFSQLLHDPRACRMLCDIEVQDTPTVVTDEEKAIERAEGDRRNREEVHRGNRFPVITKKGKPAPGRLRISRRPFHPTRDRSLRDIKAEHEKLAMDAWRSSRWVLNDHPENQFPNFLRCLSSPDGPPDSGHQLPVQTESGLVPTHHGFRRDRNEGLLNIRTKIDEWRPRRAGRAGLVLAADADVSGRQVVDVAPDSRVTGSDGPARGESAFRSTGR